MTTVTDLKKMLDVLEKHGKGDEMVQAGHDIVYLPAYTHEDALGEDLEKAGAIYSYADRHWYVFV